MDEDDYLDEFELDRHGAWWIRVRRVDVKAFAGRPALFFWRVGHDGAGQMWTGFNQDLDAATDAARTRFDNFKDLGS